MPSITAAVTCQRGLAQIEEIWQTLLTVRANHLCTTLLPDEELRRLLRAGETVLFKGPSIKWQHLEEQVESLGFGDSFCVSYLQGPNGEAAKVSPIRISDAA